MRRVLTDLLAVTVAANAWHLIVLAARYFTARPRSRGNPIVVDVELLDDFYS